MAANLFLFYGSDAVALKRKLKAWTDKLATQSEILLDSTFLEASTTSEEELIQALSQVPLLAGKRLVVIADLITQGKSLQAKFLRYLPQLPASTVVVLTENTEVDERAEIVAAIKEHGQVFHFPSPTPLAMRKQAQALFDEAKRSITPEGLTLLLTRVGNDTTALQNESQKLILYADQRPITKQIVEMLVAAPFESRIFALVETILDQKAERATELMLQELDGGTPALQIVALLIGNIRRLIIVADASAKKRTEKEILGWVKVPPFVLAKLRRVIVKTSFQELLAYYDRLVMADLALKSGFEVEPVMLGLVQFNNG